MIVTGCIVRVDGVKEKDAWHTIQDGGLDKLGTLLANHLVTNRSLDLFVKEQDMTEGKIKADWVYFVDEHNQTVELDGMSYSYGEFLVFTSVDCCPRFLLDSFDNHSAECSDVSRSMSLNLNKISMNGARASPCTFSTRKPSDWGGIVNSLEKDEPMIKI